MVNAKAKTKMKTAMAIPFNNVGYLSIAPEIDHPLPDRRVGADRLTC
jgi:hypothetical protein